MGKVKQALTPNPLSVYLPLASLLTSVALRLLGEQRQGPFALLCAFSIGMG